MGKTFKPVLIILVLFCLHTSSSYAQSSCASYNFARNQVFRFCNDLPYLNSFLHWNYDQSAKTVKIAYRHTGVSSSRWVAWAINPTGRGMVGAQALVAFQKADGTMRAYTAPVSGYQTQLQEGDLSFPVSDLSATYARNEMIIFATLKLDNLSSTVNQVWQEGPVSGDSPAMHSTTGPNVQSTGNLNLLSGATGTTGGADIVQIFVCFNSWIAKCSKLGILLPIGAVFARLGNWSPAGKPVSGVQYTSHRIIGIVLFCLGTLQVSALLLRPKKGAQTQILLEHLPPLHRILCHSPQHYQHFQGFDILNPQEKWKTAYIGILIGLAFVAAILEVYTWFVVVKRKKSSSHQKMQNGVNGTNGYNGYGARSQDRV
ncbi:hypothetical protein DH2020_027215 [Rehmannia glutinosa]|uniref:DOMON domain-containing protein n=1 Tax=Rehmannia glutinosa TaxID=99300 RepID=A0ABR0VUZ0_REHGL